MGAGAEHIGVHALPARVVAARGVVNVGHAVGVAQVVQLERAQHDERHEARQEHHDHEGVEDAEPVDLRLEEVVLQVPVEPALERHLRLREPHRRRQRDRATGHALW